MPRRFVSVTVSRLRSQEPQGRVPVPCKPHCHRCHRHRCHRWREPLVHTRQPRFYGVIVVGNGGGSVACCDFSHCSSSRMCGGVAWDWSMCLQGAGGRWRGECPACWAARIFSLVREKIFPGQGTNFPVRKGQISHSCRGRILSENGWSTGGSSCGGDWGRGGGVLLFVNIFHNRHPRR